MADQAVAGGLAWAYGELPSVLMLLYILVRWQRDEARGWVKAEKKLATEGTPDLDAYNDYLIQLSAQPEPKRSTFS